MDESEEEKLGGKERPVKREAKTRGEAMRRKEGKE